MEEVLVASLRQEILLFSLQQFVIVLFTVTIGLGLSLHAHRTTAGWPSVLQVVVIVSATFAIARADLLMHRAGAYIASIEARSATDPGWERFKDLHVSTPLVPAYDAMSVLIVLLLFVDGERRAWAALPNRYRKPFFLITAGLQLIGLAAIPFAVWVSKL